MKLLGNILASFILSAIGLLVADRVLASVTLAPSLAGFALTAGLFTLLYLALLPVLKFVLTPFIMLTFGLLSFVLNAAALWMLDFYSATLTIDSLSGLVYTTLILSLLHTFCYPLLKRLW